MTFNSLINKLISENSIGIMGTDTVYGIVARAEDKNAVARLYKLKERQIKPGTIVAANIDQLVSLGLRRSYLTPFQPYWPNSLSVVIASSNPKLKYLHQGLNSLAVRIPKDPFFRKVLQKIGPLLTSSANPPGKETARNIHEARKYFNNSVDFYYDSGYLDNTKASTIIKLYDDSFEVLRQGEYIFKP